MPINIIDWHQMLAIYLYTMTLKKTVAIFSFYVLIPGDINNILHSLSKIVDFYSKSVVQSNIDGLYGLRVVEGGYVMIYFQTVLYNLWSETNLHVFANVI